MAAGVFQRNVFQWNVFQLFSLGIRKLTCVAKFSGISCKCRMHTITSEVKK